jgi:hypothetical protein
MQRLAVISILALASCGTPPQPTSATSQAALVFDVESGPAGHSLVIQNQTGSPMGFQRDITVERQTATGWERIETVGLYLRASCDSPEPSACVDLAPGTFRAAPWTGMFGDAQCACEECAPSGPGTYRFAFTPCDGSTRHETATFTIP